MAPNYSSLKIIPSFSKTRKMTSDKQDVYYFTRFIEKDTKRDTTAGCSSFLCTEMVAKKNTHNSFKISSGQI